MTIENQFENQLKIPQIIFPVIQPNINIEALTRESEKLVGILGRKSLVTSVTCEASMLRRIASYRGKRDNDVSQERSG
jgi:hypothetical protein